MASETPISKKAFCSKTTALWALTQNGCDLAVRIAKSIHGVRLFVGRSVRQAPGEATRFENLPKTVEREFGDFSAHVFVMATGIAVRVIAPHARNKRTDPAVVVVDDAGKFAISLLSGHLGGANALANRIAEIINALPVVTTATDVNRVPAIDLLASKYGLFIENPEAIKLVGMALLKG